MIRFSYERSLHCYVEAILATCPLFTCPKSPKFAILRSNAALATLDGPTMVPAYVSLQLLDELNVVLPVPSENVMLSFAQVVAYSTD